MLQRLSANTQVNKAIQVANDIFFLLLLIQLWISRIAAASREHGLKYPVLVHNLAKVSFITTFFFVYSAVIFMNTKCPPLSVCAYRAACNSTDVLSAR